jgi:hypothetical protein
MPVNVEKLFYSPLFLLRIGSVDGSDNQSLTELVRLRRDHESILGEDRCVFGAINPGNLLLQIQALFAVH